MQSVSLSSKQMMIREASISTSILLLRLML